jgi:hypothetical protein
MNGLEFIEQLPWTILGAVLTLMIFSYLLGDNPLFRLALHIFVGASVAYVLIVALQSVILPVLLPPESSESNLAWVVSLVGVLLGALLLARGIPGLSWLSTLSVAVLLGTGIGVAVGGAVIGTLMPQLDAATNPAVPASIPDLLQPLVQIVAVLGTVTALLVFSFTRRQPVRRFWNRLINRGAGIGRWFILIGFGAAYGGLLVASLGFFADRVHYLLKVIEQLSSG